MVAQVLRVKYYRPTIRRYCTKYMKKCEECHKFYNISHLLVKELHNIKASWPFATWGVYIVGPFPPAKGQVKFLLVGIDHFTKWIEAKLVAVVSTTNVKRLIWKNIVCKFEIPKTLIFDNGK